MGWEIYAIGNDTDHGDNPWPLMADYSCGMRVWLHDMPRLINILDKEAYYRGLSCTDCYQPFLAISGHFRPFLTKSLPVWSLDVANLSPFCFVKRCGEWYYWGGMHWYASWMRMARSNLFQFGLYMLQILAHIIEVSLALTVTNHFWPFPTISDQISSSLVSRCCKY